MTERQARLVSIELDESAAVRRSAEIEHEWAVAVYDLLEENSFAPVDRRSKDRPGPFSLVLALEEARLVFYIGDENKQLITSLWLSLRPFRRLIKDYFQVCESYFEAIKTATAAKIEALDMGRRGLHNEGSELLRERLSGKVEMDKGTARRLFTLICVLHIKV
ncbi:MAG: UPF0262 family protein [Rhodospirillales bacterium]|nr:UPF0262 family protein [Rhodospirillales bacterium]